MRLLIFHSYIGIILSPLQTVKLGYWRLFRTFPTLPLPLLREGGVWEREGQSPSLKVPSLLFLRGTGAQGELKGGFASLLIFFPPLLLRRGG